MSQERFEPVRKRRKPHWFAGTFYLAFAVLGIVAAVQGVPSGLFVTVVAGLYALYLFRGGRIVIFFW